MSPGYEPSPLGLSDLKLMVELLELLHLPAGMVINRYQEGLDDVESYARGQGIPVLARIPFDREIAACYSEGRPFVKNRSEYKAMFDDLWNQIEGWEDEGTGTDKR